VCGAHSYFNIVLLSKTSLDVKWKEVFTGVSLLRHYPTDLLAQPEADHHQPNSL